MSANCSKRTTCPVALTNFRFLTSSMEDLPISSYLMLISYSYSPARYLESVFPEKAICIVCPTEAMFSPREVIFSLSTFTLISGLPSSEESFTSEAPGIFSSCFAACFANSKASFRSVAVTVRLIGACSAPISPI